MHPGWVIAAIFSSIALCIFAFTAAIYVCYRFLTIAVTLDAAFARQFKSPASTATVIGAAGEPATPFQEELRRIVTEQAKPTDGDFIPTTDEGAWANEQAAIIKEVAPAFTDDEILSFIRKATGAEAEEETTTVAPEPVPTP